MNHSTSIPSNPARQSCTSSNSPEYYLTGSRERAPEHQTAGRPPSGTRGGCWRSLRWPIPRGGGNLARYSAISVAVSTNRACRGGVGFVARPWGPVAVLVVVGAAGATSANRWNGSPLAPGFGVTHRLGLLGRRRGRLFRSASRLHVILQLGFGKVDGLDIQTGVAQHLHDLLAHVFGIGAGLGLGQLLAQFQRVVLGLGDLPGTLLCVAGAAARGQEHDKQTDQHEDDSLHECPPFRTFPRLPTIAIMGTPRNTGGAPRGPPGLTPPSGKRRRRQDSATQ